MTLLGSNASAFKKKTLKESLLANFAVIVNFWSFASLGSTKFSFGEYLSYICFRLANAHGRYLAFPTS